MHFTLIHLFYALNLFLILSCLLVFRLESGERRYSLSLIQSLLGLPLLAGEYFYLACHPDLQAAPLLLFSENTFALIWFYMAHRISRATTTTVQESRLSLFIQLLIGTVVVALAGYCLIYSPSARVEDQILVFDYYGPLYFCSIFLLITMLVAAWRLEKFWRALGPTRRWEYKFLVVGGYLVCGALGWAISYRLTYLRLIPNHFLLLAFLLLIAWFFVFYATAHHRLLNRKIFISRKIVYSFVTPSIFATYFLALGIVSLIMRIYGLSLPFVLRWLFLVLGLIALGLFAGLKKLRRRVHFFISTNFYVNKYEYRDEWLALSHLLQGALTEADVVEALRQVLTESLYTTNLVVWLGDMDRGYRPFFLRGASDSKTKTGAKTLAADNPLVQYLTTHPNFYVKDEEPDREWKAVAEKAEDFLTDLNLVLMTPLFIGDQLVGLIGIGPEFTGGLYGYDDFDLLTALGTQAASALLAVRMAEKLAHVREQQAWDKLSTFVLHDVKNAASMLSLVRENAGDHLQDPEFQQDMLAAVDDALARMSKVQTRLSMLKGEVTPVWQDIELGMFLKDRCRQPGEKSGAIKIELHCRTNILVHTDPELLYRILENLLLNALETGGNGTVVGINASRDDDQGQAVIEVKDNGPGIPEELLPDALFEPFKTTKPRGTGIGLWQVRRLMTSLRGTISAENATEGGARFVIRLPLAGVGKFNSLDHSHALVGE